MTFALLAAFLRNLIILMLAYATATLVFNAILLIPPPAKSANLAAAGANPDVTVCDYLPTGDIANCAARN